MRVTTSNVSPWAKALVGMMRQRGHRISNKIKFCVLATSLPFLGLNSTLAGPLLETPRATSDHPDFIFEWHVDVTNTGFGRASGSIDVGFETFDFFVLSEPGDSDSFSPLTFCPTDQPCDEPVVVVDEGLVNSMVILIGEVIPVPSPEPASLGMLGIGLLALMGFWAVARDNRKNSAM
jgi:hypothetical protein